MTIWDIDVPLPLAVDRVMDFLKKHAMRGADLSEIRRKDVWSIPLMILREPVIVEAGMRLQVTVCLAESRPVAELAATDSRLGSKLAAKL